MTIQSDTGIWTIGNNWPWPKIVFTNYFILAFAQKSDDKLALYELTNTNNQWTAVEKYSIGFADDILSVSVADFYTYYIISVYRRINDKDDKIILQKNISDDSVSLFNLSDMPAATTCCNYQGQLILGGLYSNESPWDNVGKCAVAWSDIGSNKMNPSEFFTAGFGKLPWDENGNGEVYKLLPLRNMVRCYGDNGCCNLVPYSQERHTGFGIGELETPGLLGPNTVAGDELIHGFVDSNYDWNIITDQGKQILGYRYFMKQLTETVIVSYDSANRAFYISDGLLCFVYNRYGMYSTNQCVSSIGNYRGIKTGFFKDNSDNKLRIKTTSFDLGHQSNQTIESVETGLTYDTTANEVFYGALSVKYDYKGSFVQLPWTPLNPRGIFTQKTAGREFKIQLQSDYESGAEFSLSSLLAKIKFSDKRNIRGRLSIR